MEETNNKPNRGGKRLGAGRKAWSPFKETTKAIRIPESQEPVIRDFLEAFKRKQDKEQLRNVSSVEQPSFNPTIIELPLFSTKVAAGFPSPADDHVEKRLDLNDYLINEADATFFVRIKGDSMIEAGIFDNDVAIVDKSRLAKVGDIVLAEVDGEFTIKSLAKSKQGLPRLLPANAKFSPIEITEGQQFAIVGVVTGSVRKFK
ncbi:MAG: translesion error-prone DNA polymerase V autoproteolytic subunit [Pseudomonadota bacterium]